MSPIWVSCYINTYWGDGMSFYYFIKGEGTMVLGYDILEVKAGDVVMIPDGVFHQVQNPTDEDLYFVCVFEGKREH